MGFLTDDERKKKGALEAIEKKKLMRAKNAAYSDEKKIETVKAYVALGGHERLTAEAMGIAIQTVKLWKTSKWWKTLLEEVKRQDKIELSSKTKKLVNLSIDALQDRLEKGDWFYDQKQGALLRKPVNANELARINELMFNQHAVLEKATAETSDEKSNEEKLAELAERFAALAEKAFAKPPVQVTDVIYLEKT